ncbi:hypothetical protein PhCBS80983_g00349 [Powellomyces hirtus]|uniref:ethanolamine kinase n=1 Tax=Powellomyces hirtus TaxID=109895 RepID=A0A507EHC4_9FUNG|nr:hypothetical protein PhCBS80983_g00349 [Powellomyces hirtus]
MLTQSPPTPSSHHGHGGKTFHSSCSSRDLPRDHHQGCRKCHVAPAAETASGLSIERVPAFSYTVNHEDLMTGVETVLHHFFPSWKVETDVKYVQCTAGITNKLVRCIHKPSDTSVLIRIYGKGTDVLIDREQEMQNLLTLSNIGLSPPIHGRFENGLVYGFVPGAQFSVEDMRDPHKSSLVAAQLARWHKVEMPGVKAAPKLFSTMWQWLDEVPATYSDPEKEAKFTTSLHMTEIRKELAEMQQTLEALNSPVTFCHNDLLSGNIVYDEKTDSVAFIDYEYGSLSYRGFDIGNHFCEHAGFDCDWSLYPSKAFQIPWLRTYLETSSSAPVDDSAVEALYREVAKFSLAAHFYWAIWALVQAEISDLDFDYLDYALTRLEYMRTVKEQYLAL